MASWLYPPSHRHKDTPLQDFLAQYHYVFSYLFGLTYRFSKVICAWLKRCPSVLTLPHGHLNERTRWPLRCIVVWGTWKPHLSKDSKSPSSDGLSKKPTMSAAAKLVSASYSWRGITARPVQEICGKAFDKPGT